MKTFARVISEANNDLDVEGVMSDLKSNPNVTDIKFLKGNAIIVGQSNSYGGGLASTDITITAQPLSVGFASLVNDMRREVRRGDVDAEIENIRKKGADVLFDIKWRASTFTFKALDSIYNN